MEKRAVNILMENVVFILLVLVFISGMYFSITRAGSQAVLFEQVYAKQIALIIDKADSGMEIELDTFDMSEIARKNDFSDNIINIDNNLNKVSVRLTNGKGYDYYFFNNVEVVWNIGKDNECKKTTRCLKLRFIKNE